MKKIIKRDGTIERFNKDKIIDAIFGAFEEVDGVITSYAEIKAGNIADYIEEIAEEKELTIEEIQDYVEKGLMSTKRKDVARAYITYRENRTRERHRRTALNKKIREKLNAQNIEKQNANIDEASFGGRIGEANSELMKDQALGYDMSALARINHLTNKIYTHDMNSFSVGMHNCLSIPFDDLLANGFNTRQTDVRPANSISTAFQLVAVIFQLQSLQQFGGVSATHLDWTMVPYVRKSFYKHWKEVLSFYLETIEEDDLVNRYVSDKEESLLMHNLFESIQILLSYSYDVDEYPINDKTFTDFEGLAYPDLSKTQLKRYKRIREKLYNQAINMTIKETQQAVEGMSHNLNTLQSRSGNQLPFTSINYGTCILPEGRMVIKALLEGSIKGVGKFHKTAIFPCGIFQLGKGINRKEGDPNYDLYKLALKSTAQRLYPNYANIDWSGNEGYDINDPKTYFSTMGCRTANGFDVNGFGQLKDGRGNIAPVTIILPTIAMLAKEEILLREQGIIGETNRNIEDIFLSMLDKKILEAKHQLIERFNHIASQPAAAAKFMYENNTMAGYIPERGILSALCHGTLAIGQIGLAETLQILIGCDHTVERGMILAKKIEKLFKDRCAEFKKERYTATDINGNEWEYGLNFGVYFTPAENLCYTAMKKFKDTYGEIPNVSDRDYFTNSIHVPVWKEISPIEKIDIESQLTGYSSAGCITYVELDGGAKNNLLALETIVNYAMDKDIPYFALNVPIDLCLNCGYSDEMNDTCPQCGGHKIQKLRRVTGYLTGSYLDAFNPGKIAEVEDRYQHVKKMRGWT